MRTWSTASGSGGGFASGTPGSSHGSSMKGRRCPNCKGDTGTEVDGELLGPEINRTFECGRCGHTWELVV